MFSLIERLDTEPWWLLLFQSSATANRGSNYSFNRTGPTSHWICKTAWNDCVTQLHMNPLTATNIHTLTLDEYIIIQCDLNIHNLNTKRVRCGKDGFHRTGAIKYTHAHVLSLITHLCLGWADVRGSDSSVCSLWGEKHVFNKDFVTLSYIENGSDETPSTSWHLFFKLGLLFLYNINANIKTTRKGTWLWLMCVWVKFYQKPKTRWPVLCCPLSACRITAHLDAHALYPSNWKRVAVKVCRCFLIGHFLYPLMGWAIFDQNHTAVYSYNGHRVVIIPNNKIKLVFFFWNPVITAFKNWMHLTHKYHIHLEVNSGVFHLMQYGDSKLLRFKRMMGSN